MRYQGPMVRRAVSTEGRDDQSRRQHEAPATPTAADVPLHVIARHTNEAFWVGSPDGARLEYVSPRHEELWHVPAAALRRDAFVRFAVVHPRDKRRVERAWTDMIAGGDYDIEYRLLQPDGSWRWVRERAYALRDESGRTERLFGIAEDVTERKEATLALLVKSEKLLDQACRDPLTGLLNRRGLERVLAREAERTRRSRGHLTAALADCDDFKAVNDAAGHDGGDVVLVEIARRIESAVRATDYVARVGGDEFVVLLPETDVCEAGPVVDRMRREVCERPFGVHGRDLHVSLSLAVAGLTDEETSMEGVLRGASDALARSKRDGKNRVTIREGSGPIVTVPR